MLYSLVLSSLIGEFGLSIAVAEPVQCKGDRIFGASFVRASIVWWVFSSGTPGKPRWKLPNTP